MNVNRRIFLRTSLGLGAASILAPLETAASAPEEPGFLKNNLHYKPRVKRVIHLCMAGGMSHLETFDPKPELVKMDGKPMPDSFTKGQQLAQLQGRALKCMGNQHPFTKCGKSGLEISNIFPYLQMQADELAIVRSMTTEQINHDPAHTLFNTGSIIPGRPSMGSWVQYALGSEAKNLPGFVVLTSVGGGQGQPLSSKQWHNGFLPGKLQGVQFQSKGDPISYVKNPHGVSEEAQQDMISTARQLNILQSKRFVDPQIITRIAQSELAHQMQSSVPELMNVSKESKETLELYGCTPGDGSYASNCLLARRLAERGVRFIQLYHRGWDHHGEMKKGSAQTAKLIDQGTAALIHDLKRRGLLEDTLIIFGGEFGRTPMAQGSGRDHHILGYSQMFCGGGIKGGSTLGMTDELGYKAVEDITHVRDIHNTMLYLLGIDHHRLTYKSQGLDFRLTGVEKSRRVRGILE